MVLFCEIGEDGGGFRITVLVLTETNKFFFSINKYCFTLFALFYQNLFLHHHHLLLLSLVDHARQTACLDVVPLFSFNLALILGYFGFLQFLILNLE